MTDSAFLVAIASIPLIACGGVTAYAVQVARVRRPHEAFLIIALVLLAPSAYVGIRSVSSAVRVGEAIATADVSPAWRLRIAAMAREEASLCALWNLVWTLPGAAWIGYWVVRTRQSAAVPESR